MLSQAVGAILCLEVVRRVPAGVENHHHVRARNVQAEASSPGKAEVRLNSLILYVVHKAMSAASHHLVEIKKRNRLGSLLNWFTMPTLESVGVIPSSLRWS